MRLLAAALVIPFAAALVAVTPLVACSTLTEDPPAPYDASPLGNGQRIADVQNPDSTTHKQAITNASGVNVNLTSLVVTWIDTFDETKDGKSVGTVYVQDVGSTAPYSAITIYEPAYIPADLRPLPGDVLDVIGPYEELGSIGSAVFGSAGGTPLTLPQLSKPVGTFRYEFQSQDPLPIALSDLDQANYLTGRKWEGMLVTVNDVWVAAGVSLSGRVTYDMAQGDSGTLSATAAAISNELYPLGASDFPGATHFKSVTGFVTWFYSFHIAPRSAADLVVAQ